MAQRKVGRKNTQETNQNHMSGTNFRENNQPADTQVQQQSTVRSKVVVSLLIVGGIFIVAGAFILADTLGSPQPTIVFATCTSSAPAVAGVPVQQNTTGEIATRLNAYTRQITQRIHSWKVGGRRDQALTKNIQDLVQQRRAIFLDALKSDPAAAARMTLPSSDQTELAKLTKNCVEQPVTRQGKLQVIHEHSLTTGQSTDHYALIEAQNQTTLYFADKPESGLTSGTTVKVSGFELDHQLLVAPTIVGGIPPVDQSSGLSVVTPVSVVVTGPQRVLVLIVNFTPAIPTSATLADAQNLFTQKIEPYYQENSYGKMSITADFRDQIQVPLAQTCDHLSTEIAAMHQIESQINLGNYDNVVVIAPFPGTPTCTWDGVATIGKSYIFNEDFPALGHVAIQDRVVRLDVVGHELGHNFGMEHAQFLDCGTASIGANCQEQEYGDLYDIMGGQYGSNYYSGHFNAVHKLAAGWLDPANVQTVSANGTFTLEPIEVLGSGLKVLKIPRSSSTAMYVEFRQPAGNVFDASLPGDVYSGALVHIKPMSNSTYSQLIDATPTPSGQPTSAVIPVGNTLVDPATGTRIRTISISGTSPNRRLTVEVSNYTIDAIPPTAQFVSPQANTYIHGTVIIDAHPVDNVGIDRVQYQAWGQGGAFSTVLTPPFQWSLDTTTLQDGLWNFNATVKDLSGNSVYIYVNNVTIDNQPPAITMSQPINGTTVSGSAVPIVATVSDNISIQRVDFYLNGTILIGSDTTAPYSLNWNSTTVGNNNYVLMAKATDQAGNVTTTQPITITTHNGSGGGGGIRKIPI